LVRVVSGPSSPPFLHQGTSASVPQFSPPWLRFSSSSSGCGRRPASQKCLEPRGTGHTQGLHATRRRGARFRRRRPSRSRATPERLRKRAGPVGVGPVVPRSLFVVEARPPREMGDKRSRKGQRPRAEPAASSPTPRVRRRQAPPAADSQRRQEGLGAAHQRPRPGSEGGWAGRSRRGSGASLLALGDHPVFAKSRSGETTRMSGRCAGCDRTLGARLGERPLV